MAELAADYALFVAELITVLGLLLIAALIVVGMSRRGAQPDGLEVQHLNRRLEEHADVLRRVVHGKDRFRKLLKRRAKERKKEKKASGEGDERSRVFVLDFKGDLRASAAQSLRHEVSAVLAVATERDLVFVRLENSGGTVHDHGFAASQLVRIKKQGIPLYVAVDKVAASGGYLMACVADKIIAAPFAIIGSIGVLAQLPNFNRLLESKGVEFEQIAAGRYKRTLTMFGKNTDEGREKLKEELAEVHELFKRLIAEHRPQVDVEAVATGEHWYGAKALELKLIDEIASSDDWLLAAARDREVYKVTYKRRRNWSERVLGGVESLLSR
ncbi:MAG TPA: protease SohB [Gammaproteobacteria bacterium]